MTVDAPRPVVDVLAKAARANYVQDQEMLQLGVAQKKIEKENSRLIEEMIYGAPKGGEMTFACWPHDN